MWKVVLLYLIEEISIEISMQLSLGVLKIFRKMPTLVTIENFAFPDQNFFFFILKSSTVWC